MKAVFYLVASYYITGYSKGKSLGMDLFDTRSENRALVLYLTIDSSTFSGAHVKAPKKTFIFRVQTELGTLILHHRHYRE